MNAHFDALEAQFESLATKAQVAELRQAFRTQTKVLMAMNVTLVGLILAAVKIH